MPGIRLNRAQLGSNLNQIPYKSDALFWLDGLILDESGTKYFRDKTGNNRKFLITGYDFDSTWLAGMPYKSAATISAPTGDTALIAADVNNYLYTAGVPNQIPVVSLFQDVDYAHKLFCRHYDQVLDANGVEIQEPRVLDLVLYSTVKVGGELINCQNYFKVPLMQISNIREVGTGKTYASIQAAVTAAVANDVIYVFSGSYNETNFLNITKALKIQAVGYVVLSSTGTTTVINIADNTNINNVVIDSKNTVSYAISTAGTLKTMTFNNCKLDNVKQNIYVSFSTDKLQFKYCVNKNTSIKAATFKDVVFDTSYFENIKIGVSKDSDFKNSKINVSALDTYVITFTDCNVNFIGNKSVTSNYLLKSAAATMATEKAVNFKFNSVELTDNTTVNKNAVVWVDGVNNKYLVTVYDNNAVCNAPIARDGVNFFFYYIIDNKLDYQRNYTKSTTIKMYSHVYANFSTQPALPVKFIIKNNSVITSSQSGTGITICNENAYVNAINESEITGNYVQGDTTEGTLHGILANCGINLKIAYNKIIGCRSGLVVKSGGTSMPYTSGGVYSNIIANCGEGLWVRGVLALNVFNNTIVNSLTQCITVDENGAIVGDQFSENIICKNNILTNANASGSIIRFDAHAAANGCIAENNQLFGGQYLLSDLIYYSDLATAQAANKLLNCVVSDPLLDVNLIPLFSINGIDLGADYDEGLDVLTDWTIPTIVTKQQGAIWQKGAYIQ